MEIDLTPLALIIEGMFLYPHEAHDSVGLNLVVGIRILIKVVMWYVFFILLSAGCIRLCRRVSRLRGQEDETAAYKERRKQFHQELKNLQKDREQSRLEIRSLQEELQQLRSKAQLQEQLHRDTLQSQAAQEQELTFLRQDRQQFLSVLEQRWQEVCSQQEKLQQLWSQAQHWEMLHRDREQTLAMMNQELAVCKAELAFFKQDRQQLLSVLEQRWQEIRSLQEELQKLSSQAEHCQKLHCDTLKRQAAFEEELAFHRQERQQVLSAQEQSRQEVDSLQEELKKLSIRAQNWEQLQFDALQSQTAQVKELAFLKQDRQQLLSAQEQCRQEVCSFQEELQKLRSQAQCWEMVHCVRE